MDNRRLHHLSGWDIAQKIGCFYSGDINTIDHGGLFYKLDDVEHDYIPCVEFSEADGMRFYQTGSINIPHTTWEGACKLVQDCLAQFSEGEREALADQPTFAHVMTDYLRFQYGIADDRFVWFVTPSDVEEATGFDPSGIDAVRHKDEIARWLEKNPRQPDLLTENQALNDALRGL